MTDRGNPPRLKRVGDSAPRSCATCIEFSDVGYCNRYRLPVDREECCDSYSSIFQFGRRQAATP